jgi:hypothetical protein
MMPLLYCEFAYCTRCYPNAIVHPAGRINDTVRWALRRLVTTMSYEHHFDLCRFQAERKCREEWSSETHPYCRWLKCQHKKG